MRLDIWKQFAAVRRAWLRENRISLRGGLLMGCKREDVERTAVMAKKYVRLKEGAERYSMGLNKFRDLAREAKAIYKVDKLVLINCDLFDKYLETFREY